MEMYRANENFILREISGESILVPVGEAGVLNNSMITLNDTCSFLWKQFQTPRTVEEVVREANECYSGDAEIIEREIIQFVTEYLDAGLLKKE